MTGIKRQDERLKEYYEDDGRFADVFNAGLFGGQQVVDPARLESEDPEHRIAEAKPASGRSDLARVARSCPALGVELALLILEAQSYIDYAMPVRILVGDALRYRGMVADLQRRHTNADGSRKGLVGSNEFLSGISKGETVAPVLTMVLYTGREPWDGPTDLHGMMGPVDRRVLQHLNNWKVDIVQARFDSGLAFARDDNRALFSAARMAGAAAPREEKVGSILKTALPFADAPDVLEAMEAVTGIGRLGKLVRKAREGKDMDGIVSQWALDYFQDAVSQGKAIGEATGKAIGEATGKAKGEAIGIIKGEALGIILFARSLDKDPAFVRGKLAELMGIDDQEAERYIAAYEAGELK